MSRIDPDRPPRHRTLWFDPTSLIPTYLGVLVIAVGFALIGLAWADIAGETIVSRQLPYLVSAGFTGLGLAMVGLVLLSTAIRRQDGARRDRHYETLAETFGSILQQIERQERQEQERQLTPRSEPSQ